MSPETPSQRTQVCPTCGTRLAETAARCPVCGTDLGAKAKPAAPQKQQAAARPISAAPAELVNQAAAQVQLLNEQISRAKIAAPFTGVVVTGDLSQQLGSPVERGKVLFEVAPLENYRVRMQVNEQDIVWLKVGQTGHMVLNSLPELAFPVTVAKITPVSTAIEGGSYFLVEASVQEVSERLRPGMEGVSKIEIGKRSLLWIVMHDLIDWVRLWLWSWLP